MTVPTRKIATFVRVEFEDGTSMEWSDIHARFNVSENCRLADSKVVDTWDEFYLSWFLPISAVKEVEEAYEADEPTDMTKFFEDPRFAGIADGKVFYNDGTSERIAS